MTKKKVLIGSLIGIIAGLFLLNSKQSVFCRDIYEGYGTTECYYATQMDGVAFIEFISIPLFFITLLLFFFRNEVFDFWFKFARIGLPLFVLIIMNASSRVGSLASDRQIFFTIFSIAFFAISFILIAYKIFRLKKIK